MCEGKVTSSAGLGDKSLALCSKMGGLCEDKLLMIVSPHDDRSAFYNKFVRSENLASVAAQKLNIRQLDGSTGWNWPRGTSRNNDQVHINYGQWVFNWKTSNQIGNRSLHISIICSKWSLQSYKIHKISGLLSGFGDFFAIKKSICITRASVLITLSKVCLLPLLPVEPYQFVAGTYD